MSDPNRTQMAPAPTLDPNRTVMGTAPTINATQTIKPVQCPICKTFNPAGMMFCVECGLIFDRALPDDAFGAPAVKLPCLVESSGREHPVRPGINVVGREGDIALPDPKVSRKHAQVHSEDVGMFIEDLGSTNGTLLNGDRVNPGEKRAMQAGDTVSFGGVELKLSLPGQAGATQMLGGNKTAAMPAAPSAAKEAESAPPESVADFVPAAYLVNGDDRLPLKSGASTFGRRPDNDVSIADPYVSGKHGLIEIESDGCFFTDTGSTNGTYLDGAKLEAGARTRIGDEDVLVIGSLELKIERA